jgi:hypothetical protein
MRGPLRSLRVWWSNSLRLQALFRFEPRDQGGVELLIVRVAIAFVLANNFLFDLRPAAENWWPGAVEPLTGLKFFFNYQYDEQMHPSGIANLWVITAFGDPDIFGGGGTDMTQWPLLKMAFAVALVLFCLGVSPVVSTGYVLFIVVAVGSLRNSQGNIHHGTQIVSMAMLGHWLGYVWSAISQRDWKAAAVFGGLKAERTSFFAAGQLVASAYVVAGVTKLLRSGPGWVWDSPNIAIQILKIGHQHYYGDGTTAPLLHAQRVSEHILEHPHLARMMLGGGLVVEFVAFLALYNRKMGFVVGISLVVMHAFIGYLMQLTFPLNTWIVLFYFVPLPFVLSCRWAGMRGKKGGQ